MHLSYSGVQTAGEELLFFHDIDDLLDADGERHKKPMKFKQERIFPAQKRSRAHRRRKRLV